MAFLKNIFFNLLFVTESGNSAIFIWKRTNKNSNFKAECFKVLICIHPSYFGSINNCQITSIDLFLFGDFEEKINFRTCSWWTLID
jgi:hypothetical protein